MNALPLLEGEQRLLTEVFRQHPTVECVKLFGSRAKQTHTRHSDVDLAFFGNLSSLEVQEIEAELDELPLPYHFDVKAFSEIRLPSLVDHINRVGITVYTRQL